MNWLHHVLYEQSQWLILPVFLGALFAAAEIGFRIGRRHMDSCSDGVRAQVGHIQSALLGLFALLLGFTFAMSLSRYDERRDMVVTEANAIGTAFLRSRALPEGPREEMLSLFRAYVDVRLSATSGANIVTDLRRQKDAEATRIQMLMWRLALDASASRPESQPFGLLLASINDVIDVKGERDDALANRVPEIVMLLLFGFAVLTGGLMGLGNGLVGDRAPGAAAILCFLITLVVMVIIDLDRPGRGLIRIRQDAMTSLPSTFDAPP